MSRRGRSSWHRRWPGPAGPAPAAQCLHRKTHTKVTTIWGGKKFEIRAPFDEEDEIFDVEPLS